MGLSYGDFESMDITEVTFMQLVEMKLADVLLNAVIIRKDVTKEWVKISIRILIEATFLCTKSFNNNI